MKNLLLLSNSTNFGEPYLGWPQEHLSQFYEGVNEVLFIPFAGFALGYDKYEDAVKKAFSKFNKKVVSIHQFENMQEAAKNAEAFAIGGGNTFYLFQQMHQLGLMEIIKQKAENGTPFAGWSAGSNIACPSLKTSNDMPIVEPKSFDGLRLVNFQINPHYTNKTIDGHGGETRDQRIEEFIAANQKTAVLGLPEACLLRVEKNNLTFIGNSSAKLFLYGNEPKFVEPNSNLSYLL